MMSRFTRWAGLVMVTGVLFVTAVCLLGFHEVVKGFLYGYRASVSYVPVRGDRVALGPSSDLVADLYLAEDPKENPFFVLAHGSALAGRRSALNRLLASALHARKFSVFAVDLHGYGESRDAGLAVSGDFRLEDAVIAATRHAEKHGWIGEHKLIYVGHSIGGFAVLQAARFEPRPAAVVALGTPILQAQDEAYRARVGRNALADMGLDPTLLLQGALRDYLTERDVQVQLQRGGLPPVLFVYGERWRPGTITASTLLRTIQPLRGSENQGHAVHVIPKAPHDYHVRGAAWDIVLYNEQMLRSVVDVIEEWCRRAAVLQRNRTGRREGKIARPEN